jgi:hypothetical protein
LSYWVIEKYSNLHRILEKKLQMALPTATEVRKMGSTEVARKCPEVLRNIVARQMNHDPKISANHYQATKGDVPQHFILCNPSDRRFQKSLLLRVQRRYHNQLALALVPALRSVSTRSGLRKTPERLLVTSKAK